MLITQLPSILLTLAVALCAGWLVFRIKIPGGMMLGSMFGVILLNVTTGLGTMPYIARFTSQAIAGAFIGCSLSVKELKYSFKLWKPLAILALSMVTVNIATAYIICRISPLDGVTAMLAAMPGGVNETPLIAAEMGADIATVAVLQFVRMIAGIGIYPTVIRFMDKKWQNTVDGNAEAECKEPGQEENAKTAAPRAEKTSLRRIALTMAAAGLGAYIGRATGFPAGLLIFSMLAVATLKLFFNTGEMPRSLKRFAQLLAGAYIGCTMNYADLLKLQHMLPPALALIIIYALNCVFSSFLMHKLCGFKRRDAMLATTPAGASEIALISSDMGVRDADIADIVLLHTVRLIVILLLIPQLIPIIVPLF